MGSLNHAPMQLYDLDPDAALLVLGQLQLRDRLVLRTVSKEYRRTVDLGGVQHLRVDREDLVGDDAPELGQAQDRWPSPATLQMWGRSVRGLTVGNEAVIDACLRAAKRSKMGCSDDGSEPSTSASEGDEGPPVGWHGAAQPGLPPGAPQAAPQPSLPNALQHSLTQAITQQAPLSNEQQQQHGAHTASSGLAGAERYGAAGQGALRAAVAQAAAAAAAAAEAAAEAAAGPMQGAGAQLAAAAAAEAAAAGAAEATGDSGPSHGCDWDMQGLRLQKLPLLCSRLPHLSTLRLWGMELSARDFAAAAVHCPQLTSLEYLAPPPFARQLMPQGFLFPRHVNWNGGIWAHLLHFPCLCHLTLKGWCFAGSEGYNISMLTGLRSLDIENCTNQSTDGVGFRCVSHLTNLTHLTFSRIRYPHPIPSEFSGLSAIKGLSSLTAIDADFFPDEVLAWADMHLTRLTLSTSDSQTMRGMAGLVPQLSSLVILEAPDMMLDLRIAQGLMHMPALRDLYVAWIHIRADNPVGQSLELPQVQHLALHHPYDYDGWEGSIGAILPNIHSLQLAARVNVARASTFAATLFERPLPALTTLIASASFLTVPEVATACPALTSLGIIDAKNLALHMPLEWRCKITRLALMGSLGGNISQFLGRGSGFQNLQELALLELAEEERADWLAVCHDLDCSHLKAITLAACPDVGPLHVYCLASQCPNLEEMHVFRCPKVTRQQCQQMASLLSKSSVGIFSSPETMTEEECVCAARQQAAEAAQIADIKASDYVESMWKYFYNRITLPRRARPRAVPFVCSLSEDALLHNRGGGRHHLASLAWRALSSHSTFKNRPV
uniref:F-box domain-containing protein n=1 Tax=Dunaliella tertiolecta TaxID=3047 RepID=A0A7S3QZC4_DUNTE